MAPFSNVLSGIKRLSRAFLSLVLLPVDLVRMTVLLCVLTFRFATRTNIYLLSGMPDQTRPPMKFILCRPLPSPAGWDGEYRFIVRRGLTLRFLGFCCGIKDLSLPEAIPDREISSPVCFTARQYFRMVLSIGLIWLFLVVGGMACWSLSVRYARDQVSQAEFEEKAAGLLETGAYKRARIQYLNAIQQRPSNLQAHWGLAQCSLQMKRWTEARKSLERVLDLDPSHQKARANLVELLLRQGKVNLAFMQAEQAVEMYPDDVDAMVRLGKCQQLQGRRSEARARAEAALKLSPDHRAALYLAAAVAADEEDCEAAKKYVTRAVDTIPGKELDRLVVARILGRCGDYAAAQAQLSELLKQDAANWVAAQERAELFLASGNMNAAIWEYQKLSRHESKGETFQLRLAELLLASGRLDEAHRVGETIVRQMPESKAGHMVLAMVYYQKELWISSAEQCRAALECEPQSVAARTLLARVLMQQKKYAEAARLLEYLRPEKLRDMELLVMLAECHVSLGNTRKALQAIEAAMAMDPESEAPYLLSARLHLARKDYDQAITACKKALELNPQQVIALNNLAFLISSPEAGEHHNLPEALKYAATAWSLQPGNPEIAETLGWIYYLSGKYSPAFFLLSYSARQDRYNAVTRFHLAHVLVGLERVEEAVGQLELARKLSPIIADSEEFHALWDTLAVQRARDEALP